MDSRLVVGWADSERNPWVDLSRHLGSAGVVGPWMVFSLIRQRDKVEGKYRKVRDECCVWSQSVMCVVG